MKKVFTKEWAKAAAIRAIKTVAQTAVATIGTAAAMGNVDWVAVASASALAGYYKKSETYTRTEIDGKIDTVASNAQPKGDYAEKKDIPSVPVKSVNKKTGAVQLTASDVGAASCRTYGACVYRDGRSFVDRYGS